MEKKNIEIEVNDLSSGTKGIKIKGVLDTVTSLQAEEIIAPLLDESENVIVDCTNLSYINSTGLALILKYYIHLKRKNKNLKLVNPNKLIYEIMDISGALKLLEIYKTQEEAMESLN